MLITLFLKTLFRVRCCCWKNYRGTCALLRAVTEARCTAEGSRWGVVRYLEKLQGRSALLRAVAGAVCVSEGSSGVGVKKGLQLDLLIEREIEWKRIDQYNCNKLISGRIRKGHMTHLRYRMFDKTCVTFGIQGQSSLETTMTKLHLSENDT